MAMEEGFNLHINRPIDPLVVSNAERLSQIWEMWLPNRYRSIGVSGRGEWSRTQGARLPRAQLFSGGIDSTFSLLSNRDRQKLGFAVTACGIDKVDHKNLAELIAKTEPVLQTLNYKRIVVSNNVKRHPSSITHAFTLSSSLFLLSDLFEEGTLSSDWTHASDMVVHPWGNNHITNEYFVGSDFRVRTLDGTIGRTQKIAAITAAGIDLHYLSFCRNSKVIPLNCGTCTKCIRTKAMFLVATDSIPEIFIDNSFDESLMSKLVGRRNERVELFDLYFYAKRHGSLSKIPGLSAIIEQCRTGD